MQIRIVKETELWNVLNFSAQMFWKQDLARYTEEGKEAFLAFLKYENQLKRYQTGKILLFAAYEKETVCGALELDTQGEVLFMYTDPRYQKEHLEAKLLQEACRLAVTSNMYTHLTVKTIPEKEILYRELGFEEEGAFVPEYGMMKKTLRMSVQKCCQQNQTKKKSNTGLYIGIAVMAGIMFLVFILGVLAFFVFGTVQRQKETGRTYAQEIPFDEKMIPMPEEEPEEENDGILQAEAYIAANAGYEIEEENDAFESDRSSAYFISYNINYPQLSGLSEKVEKELNEKLKNCARETVITYYENPTEEMKEWMMQQEAVVASQVNYKVTYQDENLLCVAFEDYYSVGNYNNIRVGLRSVVANVKSGEIYDLKDVISTNHTFANMWKEEAMDHYPENGFVNVYDAKELEHFFEGDSGEERISPIFMLTGEGIEIGFEYVTEDTSVGNGYLTIDFDKEELKKFQKKPKFWKMVAEEIS